MEQIKKMSWLESPRDERFEMVVPGAFKVSLIGYVMAYQLKYGRKLSMADVVLQQMSTFLAGSDLLSEHLLNIEETKKKRPAPKKAVKPTTLTRKKRAFAKSKS